MSLPKPPNLHVQAPPGVDVGVHAEKVSADLAALRRELLVPVEEIVSLRWTKNRRLLGLLLLGLFPLVAGAVFATNPAAIYFCFGAYFSVLWALFFFHFFPAAGATRQNAMGAFIATALLSAVVLFGLVAVGFGRLRDPYLGSASLLVQLGANILAVGLPAELCKALVILFYLRRGPTAPPVPAMVFYGLMSGFGFGIYEGMEPQTPPISTGAEGTSNSAAAATFNSFDGVLWLTTLPFLNAVWTAIGAYFWSLGQLHPSRRTVLWIAALAVPTLLHGLHATWVYSQPWISLVIDFVAVFPLVIYLAGGPEPEKTVPEAGVVPPRPPLPPG